MRHLMLVIVLALSALGCHEHHDHDHDHNHEANTYNSHGCGHLEYGPFVEITPGADAASGASLGYMTHGQIALEADAFGYVTLKAISEGGYAIFTDGPAVVLEDGAGEALTPTDTETSVPDCERVGHKSMYALTPGDYALRVGPYESPTSLGLVFVHPDPERTDD